jgi:hypothetical protein
LFAGFVKIIVEKQTSSFNTLTVVGVTLSGMLLIVFLVLIVIVNKWRRSLNETNSNRARKTEDQERNPAFDENLSDVYDEINDDLKDKVSTTSFL